MPESRTFSEVVSVDAALLKAGGWVIDPVKTAVCGRIKREFNQIVDAHMGGKGLVVTMRIDRVKQTGLSEDGKEYGFVVSGSYTVEPAETD